jgi:SnoaL-like domain
MIADDSTRRTIQALIEATYAALSTPGSDVAEFVGAADIVIAGSGQGEIRAGPGQAVEGATAVSSLGLRWASKRVTVWRRAEVAWAQILGSVHVVREGVDEVVPYWTTAIFGLEDGGWRWLYWGGSEPREPPRA